MTVKVERSVIITQKDGTQVQLEASDKMEILTSATVSCSSNKCASRHGADAPVSFTFVEEHVKESLEAYPEVGDYFISAVIPPRSPSFKGEALAFCGRECAIDYLRYTYVAPPPRPAVQKADSASVENPEMIATPLDGKPSAEDLDEAASRPAIAGVTASISDATGFVE